MNFRDLYITTKDISRTAICDLPFSLEVVCTRVAGWQLWNYHHKYGQHYIVAGEFEKEGLILDINVEVIVDSLWKNHAAESKR